MNVETDKGAEFVHGSSSQAAPGDADSASRIEATPRRIWNAPVPNEDGHTIWLFAGADVGAERAAALYTLIETAKLNGLNPEAYLRDVIARIADHKVSRIDELLPWNWAKASTQAAAAAA